MKFYFGSWCSLNNNNIVQENVRVSKNQLTRVLPYTIHIIYF